jgi:hypothetical protein
MKATKKVLAVAAKTPTKPNSMDSNDPPVLLLASPSPIENPKDSSDPLVLLLASPPSIERSAPTKSGKILVISDLLSPVPLQPKEKTSQAVFNPQIGAIDYFDFEKKYNILSLLIILEWIRLVSGSH